MSDVPEGYRMSEVGVIPEEWEVKNILENSTLKARIGWQGLTTSEYLEQGTYYLVTGTDFLDGKINWDICNFVDEKRYDQDKNIQLKSEDVLVTKDGTIGKIAYINNLLGKATLNSGIFVIRPKKQEYLPLYFFYVLNSVYFNSFLEQLKAGSTISHLYQKDFINFKFLVPPLPEQQAIASALTDVDALITAMKQLITKKRDIKQGAMQQLLTCKKRLPGFGGEWEVKKLGEIATVIGGGTPSTYTPNYWKGLINWFTPTEIGLYKYTYSSLRKITEEGLKKCSARILPKGTVLLTTRAGIGDVSILMDEGCTNQGFQSLVANNDISYEFLYYLVSTLKNVLIQNASGSTFLEISPNKIKQIDAKIPTLKEQQAIAQILSDMDAEIEALEQKRDKYKAIKHGMMQELLTGKTRLV